MVLIGGLAAGSCPAGAVALQVRQARGVVCALPRGTRLVAQDSVARIVLWVNPHPRLTLAGVLRREWRYCLRRPASRYQRLVVDGQLGSDLADNVRVLDVVLAGAFAADSTDTSPLAGRLPDQGEVDVVHLPSGARHSTQASPSPAGCPSSSAPSLPCLPESLVLSRTGISAWKVKEQCQVGSRVDPCGWGIQAVNARTNAEAWLDVVPERANQYVADPFGSLQLCQCVSGCSRAPETLVTWTRAGSLKSAPAPL